MELVAQPQILFLDEPTSGLGFLFFFVLSLLHVEESDETADSAAADRVMSAVSYLAQRGTSVICTIHQPSVRIFALCTHLLLLQPGSVLPARVFRFCGRLIFCCRGRMVYFGPIGEGFSEVLRYFEEKFGVKCPPGANPADFLLEQSVRSPSTQISFLFIEKYAIFFVCRKELCVN